jgi:hypothetical protein
LLPVGVLVGGDVVRLGRFEWEEVAVEPERVVLVYF